MSNDALSRLVGALELADKFPLGINRVLQHVASSCGLRFQFGMQIPTTGICVVAYAGFRESVSTPDAVSEIQRRIRNEHAEIGLAVARESFMGDTVTVSLSAIPACALLS
jgi:hypothetical protein